MPLLLTGTSAGTGDNWSPICSTSDVLANRRNIHHYTARTVVALLLFRRRLLNCRLTYLLTWPVILGSAHVEDPLDHTMSSTPVCSVGAALFYDITNEWRYNYELAFSDNRMRHCYNLGLWVRKFPEISPEKFPEIYSNLSGNLLKNVFSLYTF